MTMDELRQLLHEAVSPFIEKNNTESEINEELNPKETPKKEEEKTENKPQEIKIRFIKKVNP
jgi:hypothetical protein